MKLVQKFFQKLHGGFRFQIPFILNMTIGDAAYSLSGNQLYVTIPKKMLNLNAARGFDFKWADNSVSDGDVMQFLDRGDAAPNGRFNFRYTTVQADVTLSEGLSALLDGGAIALKVNTYESYRGKQRTLVDPNNTNVTPIGDNGILRIPASYLLQVANKAVDKAKLKTINGIDYTDVETAASTLGKKATVSAAGIVVFSDNGNVDSAILDELFRKL